ncbi:MAG TPA: tRNA (N6-threonylcarbamoyladenosine(37)-N6)-methyltransferase TrmO [Longimicrobium sp.]|nr:tRNA (N6-threonylcarbamoyladenosine(37)-N6)-methyltransferase TrmO [Longimicrobium sp.]
MDDFTLTPIGVVRSPLTDRSSAPRQADEGAPEARLVFDARYADGLRDLRAGDELILLTWLDRARRDVLRVRPRGNPDAPLTGVFATRAPDRPNPIGLHRVRVAEVVSEAELRVAELEALDGTPILDVKPVLGPVGER